ncbi:MAG: GNAT family protein [Mycobacteriales bacterium]
MSHPGWPATTSHERVGLRPLHRSDVQAWREIRLANEDWLLRWEPSSPQSWAERNSRAAFHAMHRSLSRQARDGQSLPFAITYDGALAGQITIGNVVRGSFQSGYAGYWVDGRLAGRGIMPTALALAVDHAFGPAMLHRIEVNIRPENVASRRVVEKLGFREEGFAKRFLYIDGAWRDHICFALTKEDVPRGLLNRWLSVRHTG